mmetsp:Transcript_23772/g.49226  ORF Transcript_23772/g.49226 Transcript_23772/m.49226 type:complete len:104 (-) Transcript_23772:3406-3717(-)
MTSFHKSTNNIHDSHQLSIFFTLRYWPRIASERPTFLSNKNVGYSLLFKLTKLLSPPFVDSSTLMLIEMLNFHRRRIIVGTTFIYYSHRTTSRGITQQNFFTA